MMRTKAISDRQLRMLCHALPWRDSLAMRIMRQTGLRVSDVLMLKKTDISRKMTIREKKTKKIRSVYLTDALVKECAIYASLHRGMKLFNCNRSTIYRSVHRTALKFGWTNISAHSARKAYARAFAKKHGIEATRKELRHSSLSTTLIYLQDM